MSNSGADNFAHGSFGDISGITFHGPARERLLGRQPSVSDRYLDPLFRAVVDRAERAECAKVPKLAVERILLTGWSDVAGIVELDAVDLAEFIGALSALSKDDLAPHVAEFAVYTNGADHSPSS